MEKFYKPGIIFKNEKVNKVQIRSLKRNIEISKEIENLPNFKTGDIVGFILDNNFAIEIKSAFDIVDEFLKNRKSYNQQEWGLITRTIPHLLDEEIYKEVFSSKDEWMTFVYDYLKVHNLEFALLNYEVRIIEKGRWKPGDDDSAYIAIEDRWQNDNILKPEFNYEVNTGRLVFKDPYLHSFFPEIKKVLLAKLEYKPYYKIIEDFKKSDPERWRKIEAEVENLNKKTKEKAIKEYKFENHLRSIIDETLKKVYYHKKFWLQYHYCSDLDEYYDFENLTKVKSFNEEILYH